MLLKFLQLEVGRPFRFEGQAYVKSSSMMASDQATGAQRVIPRSALVEVPAEGAPPPPVPEKDIPAAQLREAWTRYRQRIDAVAARLDEATRRELESARAELERALEL